MAHTQTEYLGLWKPQSLSIDKISSQKMFIDNIVAMEEFGKSILKNVHQSVNTLTELKAIDTSDTEIFKTGMLIIVSELGAYIFNRDSKATESNDVVAPTVGGGRWIAITANAVSKTLSTFDDANDVKKTGFYAPSSSSAKNLPPDTNDGVLIALDNRDITGVMGNIYQMFISSKSIYFRYWTWSVQGNDWTSWYGAFNKNNVLPITAGGTGANTEAKARKNLKTDMVLIDGYESLGLSDADFGTRRSDFIGNITKIVNAIDSNDNFMVEIYDSFQNTSNFSECIASVVQGSLYAAFTKAYYSVYIYGRNDANYPIIVDIIVDNVGTPYMLKYLISSNRAGERTVSNGISLFHGTSSDIWGSRNKPFFTYKGDGSTSERTIECGDNNTGYLTSDTLLITSRTHIGFATGYGGLFFNLSDGTITTFTDSEVEFDSEIGYLRIKTDNAAVNKLNVSYKCQAL